VLHPVESILEELRTFYARNDISVGPNFSLFAVQPIESVEQLTEAQKKILVYLKSLQ
jgi:hypothetical protein